MEDVLDSMRALLTTTPERWLALARSLPAELLERPAAPGEWSALGCLQHILDTETVLQTRVQAFLAGRDIPNFNPASDGSKTGPQSPLALAEEFARRRRESLAMLEKLTPADLDRTARHSAYGMVSLHQMLHHWPAHDLNHTVQAERALMQPFIQASGPWIENYTDHLLAD